ncbi:hypothetical protein SAMN05421505_15024 [Sinosporangium album]|uniref:Uncharacterized protein n=1 Tax=Sinosporangium album TaxID=504805 RepID=A0A1G8KHC4_9ACTN|nr:hypothetical protein [Sinosporangium album]SDI42280.1 hypothetical protein SAMN05421505_15024 [Sinosporangium album]
MKQAAGDTYKLLHSQQAHIDKARCVRVVEGNGVSINAPDSSCEGPGTGVAEAVQGERRAGKSVSLRWGRLRD